MQIHPFKQFRIDNKVDQKYLALILGLSIPSISRIETGGQKVTIEIAERAEEKLGIPRLDLLYPTPPEKVTQKLSTYNRFVHRVKSLFSWGKPPKA